jgi:hypothetical protein
LRETVEGSLEDAKELIERVRRMRAELAGARAQDQVADAVEVRQ